jgi:serine protease Do
MSNVSTRLSVDVSEKKTRCFRDPFFRQFFDAPRQLEREVQAVGSGVIVDPQQGYVLTTNHMVEHAFAIEAATKDNRRVQPRKCSSQTI